MPVSDPTIAMPASRKPAIQQSDLEFAMLDPLLVNLPGLFRGVPSKAYKLSDLPTLELGPYEYGESGLSISAACPAPLCGDDAHVLQTLVCVAAIQWNVIKYRDASSHTARTRSLLDKMHGAAKTRWKPHRLATCSLTHLLKLLGWPVSGTYRHRVLESLDRLAAVQITVEGDSPSDPAASTNGTYRLLTHDAAEEDDERSRSVCILLNPRQSSVIASGKDSPKQKPYIEIQMSEARALPRDDLPRLIHQRLCAWLSQGAERSVKYETLYKYAFHDDDWSATVRATRRESDELTQRNRHRALFMAINALETHLPDWGVSDVPSAKSTPTAEKLVLIRRPKRPFASRRTKRARAT